MSADSTLISALAEQRPVAAVPVSPRPRFSKVLLLDGYSTRTLACVRSLGKKNVAFAVGGETRWDMSLLSRYAKEKFVYTSPKRDTQQFVQEINQFSRRFQADCVFPTSEAAIMACNQYRHELACTPIIPRQQEIDSIFSKANTLKIAESVGVAVPKTVHIYRENAGILDTLAMSFPVVVKSESSEVMLSTRAATSQKTFYASSQAELISECKARLAKGQSILLQEFIDGYGMGISGIFSQGHPVALIGHRRLRESNPMGGPSALAEAVPLDPQLLASTTAMFEKIGFTGPAMAEYKVDRRTGTAYLMEINGRLWGSVLLALAAGLDLPYLYWKILNGMDITPAETGYRAGTIGRYIIGDTKCLLMCLKGKPAHWPGAMATRGAALRAYLKSFVDRRTSELILSTDDPLPFLGRLIQPNS
jgi:predicted ATP-grasp superfamily ATP-dependent carboligase